MPMTNAEIRGHYEMHWSKQSVEAESLEHLRYSDPVEDDAMYRAYDRAIRDLAPAAIGGRILDIGSGSGRWVRLFLERYRPSRLFGVDIASASVALLERWIMSDESAGLRGDSACEFRQGNIGLAAFELGERFDLINAANVLFHIPETELFLGALVKIRDHLAPGGRAFITEYLPHGDKRTEWMQIRGRYTYRAALERCGLRLVDIRAGSFFGSDPFGVEGPDGGARTTLFSVQSMRREFRAKLRDPQLREGFGRLMVEMERAALGFCEDKIAPIDLPGQKLIIVERA
ncbi:MAG: class I SAM-dependent methyltransferase [Planctomycetota bacterium]